MNRSSIHRIPRFPLRCRRTLPWLVSVLTLSGNLRAQILPPLTTPKSERNLSALPQLFIREFQFEGNTAFSDEELSKVTASFTNRQVNSEDLELARRAITLHYVSHGYISSGAVIPDQDPANGIILIRIVEGILSATDLHVNWWLRDSYIISHVRRWSDRPVNINKLQDGLQLFRQNPNVKQINAELKPGTSPGESILDLQVEDRQPFRLGLQIDNQRPPSVGAEELWVLASDLNLTGHSDPLEFRYGLLNSTDDSVEFSGADNLEGAYSFPLARFGTTLGVHAGRRDTRLVEEVFAPLDVKSLTTSYGFTLRQPVFQTANDEVALSAGFDYRKNRTWLLGERFSLSPGADQGEMIASVLRLSQDWISRRQNHVLALRSTFNFGLDAFDSTDNEISGDANATFFAWVGQGQYVRRLFNTQNEFIFRLAGQWTSEPLLALEQFSVGGFESVRGYLENQMVRDRGILSSIEFRLPVLYNKAGAGMLYVAPFFDFGGAWNVKDSPSPETIASTGLGLLFSPNKYISAEIYWGYQLLDADNPDDSGLQENGFGFKVNINAF